MVEPAHRDAAPACTVAAIRQPISLADQFGVIDVDPDDPRKIREFLEKPTDPTGLPDTPDEVLASHGQLRLRRRRPGRGGHPRRRRATGTKHDMGGDIVPGVRAPRRGRRLRLQGQRGARAPTDRDRGYWRDVGTMRSYYDAHMDLVSVRCRSSTSTTTSGRSSPTTARTRRPSSSTAGTAEFGEAHQLDRLPRRASSRGAHVDELGARRRAATSTRAPRSTDSVLLDGVEVGRHAVVRRAIIDKNVVVPEDARIGRRPRGRTGPAASCHRVGLTVIGKGQVIKA